MVERSENEERIKRLGIITASLQNTACPDNEVFCHFIQRNITTPITYGCLRREAARYAGYFQAHGVQPGEVVAIILPHSPDLFAAFLGAMLAGAVPSFMPVRTNKQDPQLYWTSHAKLFTRLGSGALLTSRENLPAIRENLPDSPLRAFAAEEVAAFPSEFAPVVVTPDQIALLQHSSGTTGLKKGVALSHDAVVCQVDSYARALRLSHTDRIVSWLPLYHDMGLIACFLLPLITRTPVVMLDPFEWVLNPATLFDAIKLHRGTLCWQPNFAFHHLCRTVRPTARLDLSSMRAWIDCSEPCRAETFDLFAQHFASAGTTIAQLHTCYAMAETVFAVTQTDTLQPPRVLEIDREALRDGGRIMAPGTPASTQRALSAGRPISALKVRIVDADAAPLPENRVGEICVAGECLFSGYHRIEEETQRKLRDGWYHTGDLGFLHEGELFVTGRQNDLIIVHGRNYYAHELEYIVNEVPGAHPGRNVAAGWFRPEVGSEDVVIMAEFDDNGTTVPSGFIHDIKQTLLTQTGLQVFDVHLVPPGWLVKTTSGKLSRVANLNKYLAAIAESPAQAV